MTRKISMGVTLCWLGLVTGCDEMVDDKPFCANGPQSICEPSGFPFVTSAGSLTDCQTTPGCSTSKTTTTLSQPQAGTVCLKGTVEAPAGYAWLLLQVSHWNQSATRIVDVLDVKTLGITGLQFTIDHPPSAGVTLFATTAHTRSCPGGPPTCLDGWNLTTGRTDVIKAFQTTGPQSVPFTNFLHDPGGDGLANMTALTHFIFVVGPGAYDFCVSDLAFVNAAGATVNP